MTVALASQPEQGTSIGQTIETNRCEAQGEQPAILADVYNEGINIAIWKRDLSGTLQEAVDNFIESNPSFQTTLMVPTGDALPPIQEALGPCGRSALSEDIAQLVEMYCFLFGLKRAGVCLRMLDRAMCPRFHTDKVPCRLVTTYHGVATEWLPNGVVDRSHLGPRSSGKTDHECGLFRDEGDIRRLSRGDVALLKGELWKGNESTGLVHRSPSPLAGERRLLLSLDFSA